MNIEINGLPVVQPPTLEMASLRLPDAEDYNLNARRRSDGSVKTSWPYRPVHMANFSQRVDILGNSLLELATLQHHTESPSPFQDEDEGAYHNNTFANSTFSMSELLYRHTAVMTTVFCVGYLLVFIVGLVGNCFVIAVVLRTPRMRTVTNYFIVNLAVADILVNVFCMPATLMSNIFVSWMMGWWMCKMVAYVQGISVAASVYSLIAVSVDRLLAIWWPLKCQITKRRARSIIFLIWALAVSMTIPWLLFFEQVTYLDMPGVNVCVEMWPDRYWDAMYFVVINLLCFYVLPLAIIIACYVLIWIKVWKRSIPSDTKDAQMERLQQKSKIKVVKMLVVVVILFILSWLPLYVIFWRVKLGGEMQPWEDEILRVATPIAQWLGASNSSINPILYAFFNKKYRRGFAAIIRSRRCCGRLRYYETVALMSSSNSLRKSSYYVNNNNSSTRRPPSQDTSVSYIFNNTGV